MKKIKLLVIIIVTILRFTIAYSTMETGRSSATFLKIPIGARIIGMGESYTAIGDEPYALFGNVAGIAKNRNLEISFSHLEWFGDTDYEFIGFIYPLSKGFSGYTGSAGFSLNYLHLPLFFSYDDWGEIKESVSFSDFAVTVGYAQPVAKFRSGTINAGISIKYIGEILNRYYDDAIAFSMGFVYSLKIPPFTLFRKRLRNKILDIGFLIENWSIGTDIGGYPTPVIYKFGLGLAPYKSFLASMDIHIPLDNRVRINMGCEYSLKDTLFFRAGYRFLGYEVDSLSWGMGIKFNFQGKIVKTDISYAPVSTLGNTISFSVSLQYPGKLPTKKKKLVNILYYKGIYYYVNKKYEKAIQLWQECLKIDPDFQPAKDKIKDAYYLMELQKIEKVVPEEYKK